MDRKKPEVHPTGKGFIALHRRFFEGWTWSLTNNQKVVWLYLLYRARWKRGRERWWDGKRFVDVNRGECIVSLESVAKACRVSRGVVRRTFAILTEDGAILANPKANRYTRVTITNYESYQSYQNKESQQLSQPRANREPTESQPTDTEGIKITKGTRKEEHPQTPSRSRARARPTYPPGFLACWVEYPHYRDRSKKAKAAQVWRRDRLEEQAEGVLEHVRALKADPESEREGGRFVPGFQVWLDGRDFGEPPNVSSRTKSAPTAYGWADERPNRQVTPEERRRIVEEGSRGS